MEHDRTNDPGQNDARPDGGGADAWSDATDRLREGFRAASRRRFSVRGRSGAELVTLPLPIAIVLAFVLIAWKPLLALVAIGVALCAGVRFVVEVEDSTGGAPPAGRGPGTGA